MRQGRDNYAKHSGTDYQATKHPHKQQIKRDNQATVARKAKIKRKNQKRSHGGIRFL